MKLTWTGVKVSSSQFRPPHSDTFNLFAEHCSPVSVPHRTHARGTPDLHKNKTAASRCSVGSEDVLKAYEEFNSLNLEAGRPVEPWMAGASDQLPLAASNSDQAALIAQWG